MTGEGPLNDVDKRPSIELPLGYTFAGVHCGLKPSGKRDLTVVASEAPVAAAGVYTRNVVCAAPVIIDRQRTPSDNVRAVIVNSGNANACTGGQGLNDAHEMLALTASAVGCDASQVLVMSTGVIGVPLDMPKIREGIGRATHALGETPASFWNAAEGIMTTDTCPKAAGRAVELEGQGERRFVAMAKGSGMIAPNMATMLGLVLTDVCLSPFEAQAILQRVTDQTFNRITVDGHTSTNDTVLMLSRRIECHLGEKALAQIEEVVFSICKDLADAIIDDGEGAKHRIDIQVDGCASDQEASRIASAVANSPLVKTAVAGNDPNWGRIVSAAGYAGVPFDPAEVRLSLNGFLLFERGMPVHFDEEAVSRSMRQSHVISVRLQFAEGAGAARVQTVDLTAEYVRINADYRS